jgi:hypothetical protein
MQSAFDAGFDAGFEAGVRCSSVSGRCRLSALFSLLLHRIGSSSLALQSSVLPLCRSCLVDSPVQLSPQLQALVSLPDLRLPQVQSFSALRRAFSALHRFSFRGCPGSTICTGSSRVCSDRLNGTNCKYSTAGSLHM